MMNSKIKSIKKMKKLILLFLIIFSVPIIAQKNIPYVILISFDGFRWDYVNRGITPNLQNMIDDGVHALSLRPSFPSKTFPNHYSIITGLYPENHGIISNSFTDPFTGEGYRLGDTLSVRDAKWYRGEAFWETAERQGVRTASYFWPGSEVELDYRRPAYYKKYEHNKPYKERIDTVIKWLSLPEEERPHFITIYFDAADTYGHKYGPNSPELNNTLTELDSLVFYFKNNLHKTELEDSINFIIVSDHGMTEISPEKIIDVSDIIDVSKVDISGMGPFMMIDVDFSGDSIYQVLKNDLSNCSVFKKEDIPEYYHFSGNPFIKDIFILADLGWSLVNGTKKNEGYRKGAHGYSNHQTDMHGIFIAEGPKFKNNFKSGSFWNTDIYPLLAEIFKIQPKQNIDGKLDRIEFILKEEE